jgi:2-methylcitrate dehydratase PrpD
MLARDLVRTVRAGGKPLPERPPTPLAARWSLPIVVAARIVEGKVDLDTFERPAANAVRVLARRIAWEPLPDTGYPKRFDAEIVCGRHRIRVDDVDGCPPRAASPERVMGKFRANAGRSLSEADAEAMARAIDTGAPASELGGDHPAQRPGQAVTSADSCGRTPVEPARSPLAGTRDIQDRPAHIRSGR